MRIKRLERLSWIRPFRKGDRSAFALVPIYRHDLYLRTYCNPSAAFPFTGVTPDFPIFEIDGDPKSALRFALFGVFVVGANPSNLQFQ